MVERRYSPCRLRRADVVLTRRLRDWVARSLTIGRIARRNLIVVLTTAPVQSRLLFRVRD